MSTDISFSSNPFLPESEVIPTDPEQLNIRLTQIHEQIANKTNLREIAVYALTEQEVGQQYFDSTNVLSYRSVIRKVVEIPALATGANAIPHGITFLSPNTYKMTRMYGSIYDNPITTYVPVPNGSIEVTVGLTNININIPITYNGYSGTFVLEWATT